MFLAEKVTELFSEADSSSAEHNNNNEKKQNKKSVAETILQIFRDLEKSNLS